MATIRPESPARSASPARPASPLRKQSSASRELKTYYYKERAKTKYKETGLYAIEYDEIVLDYNILTKGIEKYNSNPEFLKYKEMHNFLTKTVIDLFSQAYSKLNNYNYIFDVLNILIEKKFINTYDFSESVLYFIYHYLDIALTVIDNNVIDNKPLENPNPTDTKKFNENIGKIIRLLRKIIVSINHYIDLSLNYNLEQIKEKLRSKKLKKGINFQYQVTSEDIERVAEYIDKNRESFQKKLIDLAEKISFFFIVPPRDDLKTKETPQFPEQINKKYVDQLKKSTVKVECHGGGKKTKTNEKFEYKKKKYTIYKGSRNGKYILINNTYKNIIYLK